MRAFAWIDGELARTDDEKRQVTERKLYQPGSPQVGQLFVTGPALAGEDQDPDIDPETGKRDYGPMYVKALQLLLDADDRIRHGNAYRIEIV
jgi:hypothetical protein